VNPYRLVERAVVVGLLEHLPGDVPYSTHLELEGARGRLVNRAVGEALERLGAGRAGELSGDGRDGRDEDLAGQVRPSGNAIGTAPTDARLGGGDPRVVHGVNRLRVVRVVNEYAVERRRWPVGGLIDLVV